MVPWLRLLLLMFEQLKLWEVERGRTGALGMIGA